jgi:hypothetical protein
MHLSPILIFHICAGITCLLAGGAALVFRKGSPRHRSTGIIFAVAILGMAGSGAFMAAFMRPNMGNIFGGVLTFYLAGTGWLTVTRKEGETGFWERALLFIALAEGTGGLIFGWQAARSATGLKDGYPPALYIIFGSVALLCAAWDVRLLIRGGVFGAQRIMRHLWRMNLALLIAALSFFLGQQQVFPMAIRETHLLGAPPLVVAIVMVFWMLRVRFTNAYGRSSRIKTTRGARFGYSAEAGKAV